MSKRKKQRIPPSVTFRTFTVCFSARTVTIEGRVITCPPESDCLAFPVVSTEAIVMPREPWRVA